MNNKSEIRDSTIRDLIEKVRKENYNKYLATIRLEKIRHFIGAQVEFDFPVTALIGPNGSGKSTILGACACAYQSIEPTTIFKKSRIGDESMNNWHIEYRTIDKEINTKGSILSSLYLTDNSWSRPITLKRSTTLFGINRTVPAIENPLFTHKKKLSTSNTELNNTTITYTQIEDIDHIKKEAERVLGKSLANFQLLELTFSTPKTQIRPRKNDSIITREVAANGDIIVTRRYPKQLEIEGEEPEIKVKSSKKFTFIGDKENTKYSEFHFGAGEASVIHMIADIESQPNDALILIEEIENGLHPLAVYRMVEYLIEVAKRKNIQTIFTTHSDYALGPLPPEAVWASVNGRLQQGKLTVESLRAISGRVDQKLAIFVEDSFAKNWVEAILREELGENFEEVGVYQVFGDGNAINTHLNHTKNPAVDFHSICVIDGDSKQKDDEEKNIYRLPGDTPESTVFNSVLQNLENNIALLTVASQRPIDKQNHVADAIKSVSQTNRDPHLLFSQVGMKLNFTSEEIIRGAFLTVWMQENPDEVEKNS